MARNTGLRRGDLLGAAGITGFRGHDMRHHFAGRLLMAGADLNTVRELLEHRDFKMALPMPS